MSELRDRMIEDLKLAAYYMTSPDQLTECQVQGYILYVRDELGVAKGTFEPMFAGLKFFYLNTLGYKSPSTVAASR